jgi:hypothetical protein
MKQKKGNSSTAPPKTVKQEVIIESDSDADSMMGEDEMAERRVGK